MPHNSALRGEQMKGHAATIEGEVKMLIADWGDEGQIGKLIESGDLSEGMQRRIERSLAGDKLPGHYALGQAPSPSR